MADIRTKQMDTAIVKFLHEYITLRLFAYLVQKRGPTVLTACLTCILQLAGAAKF